MIYDYDFSLKIIDIPFSIQSVLVQDLINDIREAEATATGIRYAKIANASGNESLGGSVSVGITVDLLDDWQIRFADGNYIAKVSGGNLVGGIGGDPVAYSAGVQVLLVQSAASTVVTTGGTALTPEEHDQLMTRPSADDVWSQGDASKLLEENLGKAEIRVDDRHVTVRKRSDGSISHEFDISADKRVRTPV